MDKSSYTPLVEGASPDNPIVTKQYESADAVHPNREDYDEARRQLRERQMLSQMVRPKTFMEKLGDGVDWIIQKNNHIRLPAYLWIVFFGLWWVAMMVQAIWLPASLMSVYNQMHYTFDLQAVGDLLYWYDISLMFVFPIYVLAWAVLSLYEGIRKWKAGKEAMGIQAKNL